ncbi:FadR/GntR family transcriptional regulator [Anaerolentibacter hominis]|uniref:FadR/GntR family transcriptional regulator n=1 Tax=Anaerolentibacter hominis TaxID=3079009 RepID=UPI0031B87E14
MDAGMQEKRLSERTADDILEMITVEKRFGPGDKLPNENDLSQELNVSRTTLREAVRILVTNGIVKIERGKGTYVRTDLQFDEEGGLKPLMQAKVDARDLYEMRLIFEPEAAYLATERASEEEIHRILLLGEKIEQTIAAGKNRTEAERAFHKAIAKASHNEFMNQLMPVIYQGIDKGVCLSEEKEKAVMDTVQDHKMIMEFIRTRNPEGARNAMKIHILHAIQELELR